MLSLGRDEAAQEELREVILETFELSLKARLRAVRRLRAAPARRARHPPKAAPSQVDMAFDILCGCAAPPHVSDLIDGIKERCSVQVERASLVSSWARKVARSDRFQRTAKNTFALLEPER